MIVRIEFDMTVREQGEKDTLLKKRFEVFFPDMPERIASWVVEEIIIACNTVRQLVSFAVAKGDF